MKAWIAFAIGICPGLSSATEVHSVYSPNRSLRVEIRVDHALTYRIYSGAETLLLDSPLGFETAESGDLTIDAHLLGVNRRHVERWLRPPNPLWNSQVFDSYDENDFVFTNGLHLFVRAADDGVALRFTTERNGPLTVLNEVFTFHTPPQATLYGPAVDCAVDAEDPSDCSQNSYEHLYQNLTLPFDKDLQVQMPALVHTAQHWLALSEAEIFDYPGSTLTMNNGILSLVAARAPDQIETEMMMTWKLDVVRTRHPYLAAYPNGQKEFPWRVIQVARHESELLGHDFLARLTGARAALDFSWVHPGFTTDEWIIDAKLNLDPVRAGFTPGLNTATYKYYIDFAARQGFPYIIVDDGWTDASDQTRLNPAMDLPEIIRYGNAHGVGIILWAEYWVVVRDLEGTLERFKNLGVAGIEIDMLMRDDVEMIRFQERFAHEAARRHLHVMIHGCSKPTGLHLRYPNVIAIEAGLGHEYNKGSTAVTPRHKLDLAMVRALGGPFDYEGGSMLNNQPEKFVVDQERVQAQGTRVNELALALLLPSPLQVVAGDLTDYEADPNMLAFYRNLPTTWDETRVLAAELGKYLVLARRKGSAWYFAGINVGGERTLMLDVSFLPRSLQNLSVLRDGPQADLKARDYVAQSVLLRSSHPLQIHMSRNGGWVARTIVRQTL